MNPWRLFGVLAGLLFFAAIAAAFYQTGSANDAKAEARVLGVEMDTLEARSARDSVARVEALGAYQTVVDSLEVVSSALNVERRERRRERTQAQETMEVIIASVPDSSTMVPRETFDAVVEQASVERTAASRIIATLEADTLRLHTLWVDADAGWSAERESVALLREQARSTLEWGEAWKRAANPGIFDRMKQNVPSMLLTAGAVALAFLAL